MCYVRCPLLVVFFAVTAQAGSICQTSFLFVTWTSSFTRACNLLVLVFCLFFLSRVFAFPVYPRRRRDDKVERRSVLYIYTHPSDLLFPPAKQAGLRQFKQCFLLLHFSRHVFRRHIPVYLAGGATSETAALLYFCW